jgi:ABC-type dipeptide/oligopeptide/nickel transport system permease component
LELPIASFFENESTAFKIIVYTIPAFLLICVLSVVVYFAVRKTNLFDGVTKDTENPSPYSQKKFYSKKPEDEQSIINQDEIISV